MATAQQLIKKSRRLWDAYCRRDTKANLLKVKAHIDTMAESDAKTVKAELAKVRRVFNAEWKDKGYKAVAKKKAKRKPAKKTPRVTKAKKFTAAQNKQLRLGWGQLTPDFWISEIPERGNPYTLAAGRHKGKWDALIYSLDRGEVHDVISTGHSSAFVAAKKGERFAFASNNPRKNPTPHPPVVDPVYVGQMIGGWKVDYIGPDGPKQVWTGRADGVVLSKRFSRELVELRVEYSAARAPEDGGLEYRTRRRAPAALSATRQVPVKETRKVFVELREFSDPDSYDWDGYAVTGAKLGRSSGDLLTDLQNAVAWASDFEGIFPSGERIRKDEQMMEDVHWEETLARQEIPSGMSPREAEVYVAERAKARFLKGNPVRNAGRGWDIKKGHYIRGWLVEYSSLRDQTVMLTKPPQWGLMVMRTSGVPNQWEITLHDEKAGGPDVSPVVDEKKVRAANVRTAVDMAIKWASL